MASEHTFVASQEDRLDRLLAAEIAGLDQYQSISRSQLKRWIEDGQVRVEGEVAQKAGLLVKQGAQVVVTFLDPSPSALPSFDHPLSIQYEDESLLIIDKPAGISMHPGAGNASTTLVNALLSHFRSKGNLPEALSQDATVRGATVQRPGIVHRLDKDTTGLVVVAKTLHAHAALSAQFAARTVGRRYEALVFCTPRGKRIVNTADSGAIDAPIARHPQRRKEMSVAKSGGRRAVTHWKVKERLGYACVLEVRLETGRTHQIRIHCAHIGCPVIGDKTYGDFSGLPPALKRLHENFGRQALHAGLLEITHPVTGARLSFESSCPKDMLQLIEQFRKFSS